MTSPWVDTSPSVPQRAVKDWLFAFHHSWSVSARWAVRLMAVVTIQDEF